MWGGRERVAVRVGCARGGGRVRGNEGRVVCLLQLFDFVVERRTLSGGAVLQVLGEVGVG